MKAEPQKYCQLVWPFLYLPSSRASLSMKVISAPPPVVAEVIAPCPPATPKAAVAARFCHQVLAVRERFPVLPVLGTSRMIDLMPASALVSAAPSPMQELVERERIVGAELLVLLVEKIGQRLHLASRHLATCVWSVPSSMTSMPSILSSVMVTTMPMKCSFHGHCVRLVPTGL